MISQIFTALETADPYIVYGVMVVGCVVVVAILESLFPAYQQTNNQNRRLCANFGLAAINMGLALALPLSSAWALELCRSNGFGLLNWLASSLWISVPISVAAASLGAWLSHYAMHRVQLGPEHVPSIRCFLIDRDWYAWFALIAEAAYGSRRQGRRARRSA